MAVGRTPKGEHRFPRSVSDEAIATARQLAVSGVPRKEIARQTGISPLYLSDILRGISRVDAPGPLIPEVDETTRERRRHHAVMAKFGKKAPDWSTVEGRLGVVPDKVIAGELGITQSAVSQHRAKIGIPHQRSIPRGRKSKNGGVRPGAGRKPTGGVAASISRTVKLTPAQAAAHDEARGETPWSRWMIEAAQLAIARGSTR